MAPKPPTSKGHEVKNKAQRSPGISKPRQKATDLTTNVSKSIDIGNTDANLGETAESVTSKGTTKHLIPTSAAHGFGTSKVMPSAGYLPKDAIPISGQAVLASKSKVKKAKPIGKLDRPIHSKSKPSKIVILKVPAEKLAKITNAQVASVSLAAIKRNPPKAVDLEKSLAINPILPAVPSAYNPTNITRDTPSLKTRFDAISGRNPTASGSGFSFAEHVPEAKYIIPPNLEIQQTQNLREVPPNTLNSFRLFPIEIRQKIWTLAAAEPEPRTVSLFVISGKEKWKISGNQAQLSHVNLLKTTSRVPSLLCVNYDARRAAKQFYQQIAGETYGQTPIFFHFGVDTLFVTGFHVWSVLFGPKGYYGSLEQENTVEKIKYLTLGIPFDANARCHVAILQRFPSLKVLAVQKPIRGQQMMEDYLLDYLEEQVILAERIRHFQEFQIPEDYKNLKGGPIILWRDSEVLSQVAEIEKNGTSLQSQKKQTKPLHFSPHYWANLHDC